MDQLDPQELARLASQRNTEAFGHLYHEHLNTVFRYVYYKVSDRTLAEDLTSDVFAKAWESIDRFQWRNLPFQHWLLRIARNVVIDHWRANKRPTQSIDDLAEAPSGELEPDEQVAQKISAETLRAAIGQLPDDQRDVIILRFIEGYSHSDVAEILNKSVVAVRQIQVRGLRALHKLLEN
ncbi:MAG: hypothetical protein QOF51_1740 [Chloroflexota bacterium]|jgi:RNA polymerase sigma-70 factor (ECF subfamily)|nr:hypothetical protein [Chloroflexota bacterium]